MPLLSSWRFAIMLCALSLAMFAFANNASAFVNLHDFDYVSDGASVRGSIATLGNRLVGATQVGGANNVGTIWSYDTQGASFTNLYDFMDMEDGNKPWGGVAASGDLILGTTTDGGANDAGTLWSFDTITSSFTSLHAFESAMDGDRPIGEILTSNGVVFGTAIAGGANSTGTIWSFDLASSTFAKLHDFTYLTDGAEPIGGIALENGMLYGTARRGGANGDGTVWSFDTATSTFLNLHDFTSDTDGDTPNGGVVVNDNKIYGTTQFGGPTFGGTLWEIDISSGLFGVLHNFVALDDGAQPISKLSVEGNTVIGTAAAGGAIGDGTVWSFNADSSSFSTLHHFTATIDGDNPEGGVTLLGGTIYGTTARGGASDAGTIWSNPIPEPRSISIALVALCLPFRRRR